MPFQTFGSLAKPRIGKAMSLNRGHIDPATLTLTFHYQEQVWQDPIWVTVEREQILVEGTHYDLNPVTGSITLLDCPFWQQENTWRATDRVEPLLYKNQVKHPQKIEFAYEHYAPEEVVVVEELDKFGAGRKVIGKKAGGPAQIFDLEQVNAEALARLGYNLPEYTEASEE